MNLNPVWSPGSVANHSLIPQPLTELSLMVRIGLLEFRKRTGVAGDLDLLLADSIRHLTLDDRQCSWFDAQQRLMRALHYAPEANALKRLQMDYSLSPAQLFILGLAGEAETQHLVNLLLADLQAPARQARPCLHLIVAMLDNLFPLAGVDSGTTGVFAIIEHPLIHSQLLRVPGDDPLPLRHLQMEPLFWALLAGRTGTWPACQPLAADDDWLPQSITEQLPALVKLLGDHIVAGLTLRSLPHRGSQAVARVLAHALDLTAMQIPVDAWCNQPALRAMARYAKWLPVLTPSLAPGEVLSLPPLDNPQSLVVLFGTDGALDSEGFLEVNLELPTQDEREQLWSAAIASPELARQLASSALLGAGVIRRIGRQTGQLATLAQTPVDMTLVAKARRLLDAEKLRLLAQPVERDVRAGELVMPALVEQGLDLVIKRAHQRESLWLALGRTARATHSAGVRALFAGDSGTGKTLAASYIATALGAPLYRVDLSAVMNKYIGESEKNLGQLLDYAAANDVVLLFDEADALFGARTEGKETGERFANMLTNFLLTRLENHPGIVLLTTNNRQRIDQAFSRRIDSLVEFPLPGFEERLGLWRSHLGERGPGEECYRHLAAYCDLAGGQIRNAVLAAAVHAGGPAISQANLVTGLTAEYQKLGRTLPAKIQNLATL